MRKKRNSEFFRKSRGVTAVVGVGDYTAAGFASANMPFNSAGCGAIGSTRKLPLLLPIAEENSSALTVES